MSYAVYSTRGFILGSAPSGEASKVYFIYTEDFGLVRARAQGVRLMASKLRYNLEDYSFGVFSLVRGKELWRLTGAMREEEGGPSPGRARALSLLKRLVHGEERNDRLWQAVSESADNELPEPLIVGRILHALGYMDKADLEGRSEKEMVQAVNRALKETHLI